MHEAVVAYSRWLTETELPKLLFFAHPGGIIDKRGVTWCKRNMSNLDTVDIGKGVHYVQEDNPHLIGEKLATWYQELAV